MKMVIDRQALVPCYQPSFVRTQRSLSLDRPCEILQNQTSKLKILKLLTTSFELFIRTANTICRFLSSQGADHIKEQFVLKRKKVIPPYFSAPFRGKEVPHGQAKKGGALERSTHSKWEDHLPPPTGTAPQALNLRQLIHRGARISPVNLPTTEPQPRSAL